VKLDWALNALQANDTMRTVEQSQYRDMFREHVNGMMPDALHVDTLGEGMSLSVVTIRLPFDGYGSHFEDWLYKARDKAKVIESEVDGTSARFASGLAIQVDDKANLLRKAPGIMIATVCGMVFLFSVVAFRSLVLGPRLLLTVALTLGIVFGATAIVFTEIFWLTLVVVSPVSVGFVLDYDIFLLGRVFEFRTEGYSTSDALILGLEHTGSIITTAGIIMVSAFLALLMSSNPVVVQLGFQLSIAVLVDTFLVRTFFVPALMQIGVEWNWWPKRMPEVTKRMK
jgi:predicted RND superfamily exporter protein